MAFGPQPSPETGTLTCSGCASLRFCEGHHRFCGAEPDDHPAAYRGAGRSIPPAVLVPNWCRWLAGHPGKGGEQ
jgi:hypothetical protein